MTSANGTMPSQSDRHAAIDYLKRLKVGEKVERPAIHDKRIGDELEEAEHLVKLAKGDLVALERIYKGLAMAEGNRGKKMNPLFAELLAEEEESESPWPGVPDSELSSFAPLPESARLPKDAGVFACSWLDEYIAFSRKWSPRAYDDFHEAVGLWILSTIAARRVALAHGGKRYTPLFIALTARTSLYSKSTTADIGLSILSDCGLDWLLAPDESTPQKFIQSLAGRLPADYGSLSPEIQEYVKRQLALSGQRGWFYEEFGQHLSAMSRENGTMADFKGIIRRLDDCKAKCSRETISRGNETIIAPYVALLVGMTPADIRPYAKAGGAMWHDGFWARFAFVTPPYDSPKDDRFPRDIRYIPPALISPLITWHKRLGVPEVTVTMEEEGMYRYQRSTLPERLILWSDDAYEAYYRYDIALKSLLTRNEYKHGDFDGNYARFSEKALRIALLFASLEDSRHIEMRHWARAQEITERWRANLHYLYDQVNISEISEPERLEEKIMGVVEKLEEVTPSVIRQYIRGIDTPSARHKLIELAKAGALEEIANKRAPRYRLSANEKFIRQQAKVHSSRDARIEAIPESH